MTLTFEEVAFFSDSFIGVPSGSTYDYSGFTNADVTMPATVFPDDVLLVEIRFADTFSSPPSGWTLLVYEANFFTGGLYGRIADGSEASVTVTFPIAPQTPFALSTQPYVYTVARYSGGFATFGETFHQWEVSPTEFDFPASSSEFRSGMGLQREPASATVTVDGEATVLGSSDGANGVVHIWWDVLDFGVDAATVTFASTGADAIPSLAVLVSDIGADAYVGILAEG